LRRFFVFHDLRIKGLNKGEKFLGLLVSQKDPDRFKAEKFRQKVSHVFEKFAEGFLGANKSRELDA
jgi:hypothetical protein